MENTKLLKPFTIVANGQFPNHPLPLQILYESKTIICTDGSANLLIDKGINPNVIIGDMDSLLIDNKAFSGQFIKDSNQENTDLEKAFEWCIKNNVKTINVLGASQQREDHSITNLYLLSTYCDAINLTYVTDYFSITCHEGNRIFSSFKNQIVSILPVKHIQDISTENLKYNLSDEELPISSRGISNQSISDNFTINSSGKIWVFRSHPE
jgi:thiamine pyrophosphokinase|tara:strand:+ start:33 stop:665 length:633 start_codon:yes stop_codon:yes gene_type:complete